MVVWLLPATVWLYGFPPGEYCRYAKGETIASANEQTIQPYNHTTIQQSN